MVLHVHIDRENREHLHRTHGQADPPRKRQKMFYLLSDSQAELQRELQTEIDQLSKCEESSYNKKAHLPGARPFFQTPVLMSEDDPLLEKVPSITDASNQLWKVGIKEYEGRILSLLKEWAKDHTQWSAWISEQLHVDFNLPVALEDIFKTNVPDKHSVQAFVIGEGLPPIFLVVPYEDGKEQTSFRRYARECVRELISHLHDFCYVDFDVLPCFLDLKSLKKDTLEKEIKTQTQFSQLYFSGRRKLTPEGNRQIRDATAAIASVSYVPHVLRVPGDDTEQSREPDERIDDHERCPHCHEHYDDSQGRYAMILPCYHPLCYICTESLSSKKDVSSKEDDIVYCPSCQEKQDKNRVKKNIYINQVVIRECILCRTNYHTQTCKPKIMACYHHVCERCINMISTGVETFPCPLCRKTVSLESVKDNSYIIVRKPQRQLLLLDPEMRKVLSLMIEMFSYRDGDFHLKYSDTAEDKVRVTGLEAARRWSLTRTVSFVTQDQWIVKSKSSLIHLTGKRLRQAHPLTFSTKGESTDGSTTLQIEFAGRSLNLAPQTKDTDDLNSEEREQKAKEAKAAYEVNKAEDLEKVKNEPQVSDSKDDEAAKSPKKAAGKTETSTSFKPKEYISSDKSSSDSDEPLTTMSKTKAKEPLREYYTDIDKTTKRRGICLIFTNIEFTHCEKISSGVYDRDKVKNSFEKLGFLVIHKENCTVEQMKEDLSEVIKTVDASDSCFVCCVNSHGNKKGIWGIDSTKEEPNNVLTVTKMMSYLQYKSCSKLKGKPKLIFIDACRGEKKGTRAKGPWKSMQSRTDHATDDTDMPIPEEADFLLGYATCHGFEAYTHDVHGSRYFVELTSHLDKYADRCDILEILTMVNYAVCGKDEEHPQTPAPVTTLRKKLYLRPTKGFAREKKAMGHFTQSTKF